MNEQPTKPYTSYMPSPTQDARPTSVMAILSLVFGILFLCLGPLGLLPLVLGIVAINKTGRNGTRGGMGLAIAGTSLGGVAILGTCISASIFIPAFSTARNAAYQLDSQINTREILLGLEQYALANEGEYPEADDWSAELIHGGFIFEESFISKVGDVDGDGIIYIYLPEGYESAAAQIVIYEDPDHYEEWVVVGYADGSADRVSKKEFDLMFAEQLAEQDESP